MSNKKLTLELTETEILHLDLTLMWMSDFLINDGVSSLVELDYPCPSVENLDDLRSKIVGLIRQVTDAD